MSSVPPLFCPFPSASNPRVREAEQTSLEHLARRFGERSPSFRRVSQAQFGTMMGYCYPNASEEDLSLLLDYTYWIFLWDDICDRCDDGMGGKPEQIAALNARMYPVLHGAAAPADDQPLLGLMADILQRLGEKMSLPWVSRFVRNIEDYLEATVWQAADCERSFVPDPDTYARMRRFTGAVYPHLDLIELVERMQLPLKLRIQPLVAKLVRTSANLICWANDIYSLGKELLHGNDHNVVLVLRARHHLSLQDALNRAVELHNAEMHRFLDLEQGLGRLGLTEDERLERYVHGLRSWIRGNIDWSVTTGRYKGEVSFHLPAPSAALSA